MSATQRYENTLKNLAKRVKELRMERGWTQEEMRDHGFNYRHYQRIESGSTNPTLNTLHRLAKAFKVKISDLF